MFYEFDGFKPVVHPDAYVHPQAVVTGNVFIGAMVYIGPGAAIRGDWGKIIIEDGCNIQENCTLHMFPGTTVLLKEAAHVGHGAIIHGATLGRNCLIGMNSVLMDDSVIGDECIVGALSFISAGSVYEARKVIVGNPAKVVKDVSDEMIAWKTQGTGLYRQLPADCRASLKPCEPLREPEKGRREQMAIYERWKRDNK
jgi:carbonic anhydrase/acetyltransferase-like protein (isoleucine patch superfamily)